MRGVSDLLNRCGLNFRSIDADTAAFRLSPGPGHPGTAFEVQSSAWFLRVRAVVEACERPDLATLEYLNDHNTRSPLGSAMAWSRDAKSLTLTITLPKAADHWPAPDVVMAALTSLGQLAPTVVARRPISESTAIAIFGGDLTFDGLVSLDGFARAFERHVPLTRQRDGSYTTRRRYEDPATDFIARISHEPGAGLCVDALAEGDPLFAKDERFLLSLAELNALLPHGSVSLWAHPSSAWLALHRFAVPLPWLSLTDVPDRTLVTSDTVAALFDNASAAWDDVIRIVQGGPIARPERRVQPEDEATS